MSRSQLQMHMAYIYDWSKEKYIAQVIELSHGHPFRFVQHYELYNNFSACHLALFLCGVKFFFLLFVSFLFCVKLCEIIINNYRLCSRRERHCDFSLSLSNFFLFLLFCGLLWKGLWTFLRLFYCFDVAAWDFFVGLIAKCEVFLLFLWENGEILLNMIVWS